MTDETISGTVDRVVDGIAVVLIEDASTRTELDVSADEHGLAEGDVVRLEATVDGWRVIGTDEDATTARREELSDRLDRLREERGGGRFDRGDPPGRGTGRGGGTGPAPQ